MSIALFKGFYVVFNLNSVGKRVFLFSYLIAMLISLPVSVGRHWGGLGCIYPVKLHLHIAVLWSEYYCLQEGDIISLLSGWEIREWHQVKQQGLSHARSLSVIDTGQQGYIGFSWHLLWQQGIKQTMSKSSTTWLTDRDQIKEKKRNLTFKNFL